MTYTYEIFSITESWLKPNVNLYEIVHHNHITTYRKDRNSSIGRGVLI